MIDASIMLRNDLRNGVGGCNSRRSLRPDSGLAWPARIWPRSTGGQPNADDFLQVWHSALVGSTEAGFPKGDHGRRSSV